MYVHTENHIYEYICIRQEYNTLLGVSVYWLTMLIFFAMEYICMHFIFFHNKLQIN